MATLGPETIVHFPALRVTNSLLASALVDVVILGVVFGVGRRLRLVPGRLQGVVEAIVDYLSTTVNQVAGDRARQIFPWVAVFFFYIAFSNLIGLLPGFGSIGFHRGDRFIPLLHPYFALDRGEMHHRRRYPTNIDMGLVVRPGAGDTAEDIAIVRRLHERLARNGRGRLVLFQAHAEAQEEDRHAAIGA